MAKRRGILVTLIVIALIGLIGALEIKRQAVSAQLEDITTHLEQMQFGNTAKNQETADQIVRDVRKLMDIAQDIEPTVATIVDVEALRAKNPFYAKAENGDHLVVTPTRAILYSSAKNRIIDVVPVQLEPAGGGGSEEE
jgi:hypothetical protein|tara:strand:+ start:2944 stop:3360 length:417 start_codon:yes stop_codon:yes gene_type:complete